MPAPRSEPPSAVTMRELLGEELWRVWMKRPPPGDVLRFRLYVAKEDHSWSTSGSKLVTYSAALKWMIALLRRPDVADVFVNCPARPTPHPAKRGAEGKAEPWVPESLQVAVEAGYELWCPYCRRWTRFGYFRRHHALQIAAIPTDEKRCCVCGCGIKLARRGWRGRK